MSQPQGRSILRVFAVVVLGVFSLWPHESAGQSTRSNAKQHPTNKNDRFPQKILKSRFRPLSENFGYDPKFASKVYQRKLIFVNLDPKGFSATKVGRDARLGLAHLLTHTTNDFSVLLSARLLGQKYAGDLPTQLRDLGFLPSPFRYQLAAKAPLRISYRENGMKKIDTISVPFQFSLTESAYEYQNPKTGRSSMHAGTNCMLCHGGVYSNYIVAGAPNKNVNVEWVLRGLERAGVAQFSTAWRFSPAFTRRSLLASPLLKMAGLPPKRGALLELSDEDGNYLANASDYYRKVLRKLFSQASNETVGVQVGPMVAQARLLFHPKNAKSYDLWIPLNKIHARGSPYRKYLSRYQSKDGVELAASQSRPWWLGRYCGFHFWNGMTPYGPKESAGDLALILGTPYHGNSLTPSMEDRFEISRRLQSYVHETHSPPYPKEIDYTKATLGYRLYQQKCARCHGSVQLSAPGGLKPQTTFALRYSQDQARRTYKEVGTDSTYSRQISKSYEAFITIRSIKQAKKFGITFNAPQPDKMPHIYAPPLVGLWASAAYFHNGSVPTVYHVLNSKARPEYWKLDPDPYAYDFKNMGLVYKVLKTLPKRKKTKPEDWLVYDTTNEANGMTNVGHYYGDHLMDAERYAVIEFLKVLDTRRVRPSVLHRK